MSRKYFKLNDDVYVPGRWELGDLRNGSGVEVNGGQFNAGVPVDFDGSLWISIYRPGTPLDFSHLVGASVPIVSRRVADVLLNLAVNDIQVIPARVDSQTDDYALINVRRTVKCIDDVKSEEVHYWRPQDGRPDKLGTYSGVYGMRVDPEQIASDIRMLRPQGWTIALVVSAEIRSALERIGATGTKFRPV